MSFVNQVVIVTGSSSGIGAATAVSFAKEGADVVIVGRNKDKLRNVADKCKKAGKTPLVLLADLSEDQGAKSVTENTIAKYGKINVLVNNAGLTKVDSILSHDMLTNFDKVLSVNLRAVVLITNLAAPHLIKTKGNIVNVSSDLGTKPNGMISYAVSKAGLNHFSRCIALELAACNVRVNTVSPGPVETDIIDNCGLDGSWDQWGSMVPLKKVAQPEEVANMILYLASDKAKSIIGANVTIDNGTLLM